MAVARGVERGFRRDASFVGKEVIFFVYWEVTQWLGELLFGSDIGLMSLAVIVGVVVIGVIMGKMYAGKI